MNAIALHFGGDDASENRALMAMTIGFTTCQQAAWL
jgi:hypothetical protein